MYLHNATRSQLTLLGEAILALTDRRILVQGDRNELLTSSIRREMERTEYAGDSSFLAHMVHSLCRAYDFRDLRNIDHPISEKTIYNESVSIYRKLTGQE